MNTCKYIHIYIYREKTEKHKLKEKNRRAKKRHLLISLQYLVLG